MATDVRTRLDPDEIRAALPAHGVIGREVLVFEETDSTNDLAAQAGRDGLREGLVIFAESQRAGRGRLGRKWVSPPGHNLLFSILLRPREAVEHWADLTFCAAWAVAEAAEKYTGRPARIKWPNDVLVEGRKIAGILLETHQAPSGGFVVVGIGLNVLQAAEDFPPELRGKAGSMSMLQPENRPPPNRRNVASFVLSALDRLYAEWPRGDIRERCAERGCHPPPSP